MTCFDRSCILRKQNPIQVPRNTYSCKEIAKLFMILYIFSFEGGPSP